MSRPHAARRRAPLRGLLCVLLLATLHLPTAQADEAARQEAARVDAARLDAEIEALATALAAGDRPAARGASVRLREAGEAADERILAAWMSIEEQPALLEALLAVVAGSPTPAAERVMRRAAAHGHEGVRAAAALALARSASTLSAEGLALLARDQLPGVRAAAWTALFAREDEHARGHRAHLPPDDDPALRTRRLVLHRLRNDDGPLLAAVLPLAEASWQDGSSGAERLAAARWLCTYALESSPLARPLDLLLAIVRECGQGPVAATALRATAGRPVAGYEPVEERWAAVEAALAVLLRKDVPAEARTWVLERCFDWLVHPVAMDPARPDPIPEQVLWRKLPDLGAELLPHIERSLLPGGFRAPAEALRLLGELPPAQALPLLERLLAPGPDAALRAAASGALHTLGVMPSEALARRLLEPATEASIRREALSTLASTPEPWALALLEAALSDPDPPLLDAALDALERRDGPEARPVLARFLLGATYPEEKLAGRLARVLRPWDDVARATYRRALELPAGTPEGPGVLRGTALSLAARFPAAQLAEVLPWLRALEPTLRGAREVEAYLICLTRAAPGEALAYIRAQWDAFPVGESLASTQARALANLEAVRDPAWVAAALDLVLEKVATRRDAALLAHATEALRGRHGHRDGDLDAFFVRLLTAQDVDGGEDGGAAVAARAVWALGAPGRGDLSAHLLPLLARQAQDTEQAHRAIALLEALEHQPMAAVEPAVAGLLFDATLYAPVRAAAGRLLAGRCSPATRAMAAAQLREASQKEHDPEVLQALARVASTGGGPLLAQGFADTLVQEVNAYLATTPPPDPFDEREDALPMRVEALAQAALRAGGEVQAEQLVRLVLAEHNLAWAESVMRMARLSHVTPDPLTALGRAGDTLGVRLADGIEGLVPRETAEVMTGLRLVEDATLAKVLERVLADPEVRTRLARWPDALPAKLALMLYGGFPRSQAVLAREVGRLAPFGSPFDVDAENQAARQAWRSGRPAEALAALQRLRALLARRGDEFDARMQGAWLGLRQLEEAWAALAEGSADGDARLARAAALAQDVPSLLVEFAAAGVLAGRVPAGAEAWLRRALVLDRRADGAGSPESARLRIVLASVYVAQGRHEEALEELTQRLPDGTVPPRLLLARAHMGAGDAESARRMLRAALQQEPWRVAEVEADPLFAPWRADGTLAKVVKEAEEARARGAEE
ncbi:MAG: HEAT repeat domain-containing protein [Planctomycetia bacterium]